MRSKRSLSGRESLEWIQRLLVSIDLKKWHSHPADRGQQMAVLEAITNPERVLEGSSGGLLAIQETQPGKWLVVAYRELAALHASKR